MRLEAPLPTGLCLARSSGFAEGNEDPTNNFQKGELHVHNSFRSVRFMEHGAGIRESQRVLGKTQ